MRYFADPRDVAGAIRPHEFDRKSRSDQAGRRRPGGEHAAVDDQVTQKPAAGRAKRTADRQVAPAVHGPRHEKVDSVRAGDDQHARDGREHQQQRRLDIADDARAEVLQTPCCLLVLVGRLPDRKQPRAGGAQRLARRRLRDVRPEPRQDHRKERPLARGRGPARRGEHRHVSFKRAVGFLQHPDDGVANPVDVERSPEDRIVSAEPARPVRGSEHGDPLAVRVIRLREQTAPKRDLPHHREVGARDRLGGDPLRVAALRQGDGARLVGRNRRNAGWSASRAR